MSTINFLIHENEQLRALVKQMLAKLDIATAYADGVPIEERAEPSNHDAVNHPAHCTAGGVECIDAIEAATTGLTGGQAYNTGNVVKYVWRYSRKGGIEDLHKAAWYLQRLISSLERSVSDGEKITRTGKA